MASHIRVSDSGQKLRMPQLWPLLPRNSSTKLFALNIDVIHCSVRSLLDHQLLTSPCRWAGEEQMDDDTERELLPL